MGKRGVQKRPFLKRKSIWVWIVLALVFILPLGLVLLFMKLDGARQEREDSIPAEDYLAYSSARTQTENEAAIARERSTRRALRVTIVMMPLLGMVGGLLVTQGATFLLQGYAQQGSTALLRGIMFLLFALICAVYRHQGTARQKRIRQYLAATQAGRPLTLKDLAECGKACDETVLEDVKYMLNRGFLCANAHFDGAAQTLYPGGDT